MEDSFSMREHLNPAVRANCHLLRNAFQTAEPYPHVVVDDFLAPDLCAELIAQFPAFDSGQAVNERGERGRKAVFQDVRRLGPAYVKFDDLVSSREFLDLAGQITGIDRLLYDPEYVGGGTHENLSGQSLATHVDFNFHPRTRWHRRLNLILFLNPAWEESWGGMLQLHNSPEQERTEQIVPKANRCVIFETSERSWHGFPTIAAPEGVSRRSIAVYFYTKRRPKRETAPSHGTFYYQQPLPAHIAPGHTLTEEDAELIESLIARRDLQIKHLYNLEMEFNRIAHTPVYRLARLLTAPLRSVRGYLGRKHLLP